MLKLFGSMECNKTDYYKSLLADMRLPYQFLDVVQNKKNAEALKRLYKSEKLNFPTLIIGEKRLRNPNKEELLKWINKINTPNYEHNSRQEKT